MEIYQFGRLRVGDRVILTKAVLCGEVTVVNAEGIEVKWSDGITSYYSAEDAALLLPGTLPLGDACET